MLMKERLQSENPSRRSCHLLAEDLVVCFEDEHRPQTGSVDQQIGERFQCGRDSSPSRLMHPDHQGLGSHTHVDKTSPTVYGRDNRKCSLAQWLGKDFPPLRSLSLVNPIRLEQLNVW